MTKKILKAALYVTLSLLFSSSYAWELQKESDGIQVYTQEISIGNHEEANPTQLAYRGVTTFKASDAVLQAVIRDVANFDKWLYNSYEPREVEKISDNERIVYQRIHTPWPTTDRDSVLMQTIEKKGSITLLHLDNATHVDVPVHDDFVRIPYFKGFWQFERLNESGQVKVTYEAAFDSGGQLPAMLANVFIVDVPFNSLKLLRDYIQDKNS